MPHFLRYINITALLLLGCLFLATKAQAAEAEMADRVLGSANAPITVDEYVSFACSHCALFYNDVLPQLEKTYVDTGKVKFILHDFPLDGTSLKAALIARCMPVDEFFPFVRLLYKNQEAWAYNNTEPEKMLIQYAKLGGLAPEKAQACLQNTKLQDAIIAERTLANSKLNIEATPTFIINGGVEVIKGSQAPQAFSVVFDRLLGTKK